MTLLGVDSFGLTVYVTVQVTGLPIGTSQLEVTSLVGPAGFGTVPAPVSIPRLSTNPVNVQVLLSRTSVQPGIVTINFDIVLPGGRRCTGYSFPFSNPTGAPVLPPIVPSAGPTATSPVGR